MLFDKIQRLFSKRKKYLRPFPKILHITSSDNSAKSVQKLNPVLIPKYKNQLIKPPVYMPLNKYKHDKKYNNKNEDIYKIDIVEFKQQVLPKGFPKTRIWGYGGLVKNSKGSVAIYNKSSPGATFEAIQGIPVKVKWNNKLNSKHPFAVDPTLHWANPNQMPMDPPKPWPLFPPGFRKAQYPVPVVTHLHGGEVPSASDGHPEAWFTYNKLHGPKYVTSVYSYPNKQEPTTLWYHDHSLGMTRLNMYAGLEGFYLIREGTEKKEHCHSKHIESILPKGKYEIPIIIQDRMFLTDGSLLFNSEGINPEIHPYWRPGFLGDTITVNGKVWPYLEIERRQYRFRLLNGSNARFYNLKLSNGMKFIQIGSDGGFLPKPIILSSLLLAPAERADILIDFSGIKPGTPIILLNNAKAPYPDGSSPDPDTVGQIMQFKVSLNNPVSVKPPKLPMKLNHIPELRPTVKRLITLNEIEGNNGPTEVLLNGLKWSYPITEAPMVGATEEWMIVNLTMGTHPIHLHLIQFQVFNRQDMNTADYQKDWETRNGMPPLNHSPELVPIGPYLTGKPESPDGNEKGWKDTVRINPGQVTRIRVRFAPQKVPAGKVKPGENLFPFNPSLGPGYVWHCHILDHEDNEMMRPYKLEEKLH